MSNIYDLYSPTSPKRQDFTDELDNLQSVPDVGILDTIEAGIDKSALQAPFMATLNHVADRFPSIDNFLTGGQKRDRNLYTPDQLSQVYPDAPQGTFGNEPMTLLRASTMYDQTTADLRYEQALKIRNAGSVARFGYGASQMLEPQNLFLTVATAGASKLALARFAPEVAAQVANGGLKYMIGKDILDGTAQNLLFNAPSRVANKDYIKEQYGVGDFAQEMVGNVVGAFAIHMGAAGLNKAGLWGLESVLKRKIGVEKDLRYAEGMGDAYKRAASAFDEELAGVKSTTFTEDANKVYQRMDGVQARYSDGGGEFAFGYKPTGNPVGYRGTEPRFGRSFFSGPETLIRAASMEAKERGTLYRVSLSDTNPFQAKALTLPEGVDGFAKAELQKMAKEQLRVFSAAKEIYAEQGIKLPEEVTDMNSLIQHSVEKIGDNYRLAESALEQELTSRGYGGITYSTDKGVDVNYIFDHAMKGAQDLEDMNNEMSLNDMTNSSTRAIDYDPFADMDKVKQIGETAGVDTTSKSYNLQADGVLSNGKKIKLDPNGYFETELMFEENPDVIKSGYVETFSPEIAEQIKQDIAANSKDIEPQVKKYEEIKTGLGDAKSELQMMYEFDAKRARLEKRLEQFPKDSKQHMAIQTMIDNFEKEYKAVTLKDIEEVAKAAKVCTSRN